MTDELVNTTEVSDDDDDFAPLEDEVLLQEMVRAIVDKPEVVTVTSRMEGSRKILNVTTDPIDCGKVIGKMGQTVNIFRAYFGLVGFKNGYQVSIAVLASDGSITNHFEKPKKYLDGHRSAPPPKRY